MNINNIILPYLKQACAYKFMQTVLQCNNDSINYYDILLYNYHDNGQISLSASPIKYACIHINTFFTPFKL